MVLFLLRVSMQANCWSAIHTRNWTDILSFFFLTKIILLYKPKKTKSKENWGWGESKTETKDGYRENKVTVGPTKKINKEMKCIECGSSDM